MTERLELFKIARKTSSDKATSAIKISLNAILGKRKIYNVTDITVLFKSIEQFYFL